MLQVRNEAMNEKGTKEKESNNSYKGQQKYSFATDNRKKKKKRKTYPEALKEVFGNEVKETREKVVSDKERNAGTRENAFCVDTVMDCNEYNSSEFGKLKPIFSAIYKDLLFSEQISSSRMVSAPPVLNTDTSTSHNAHNSSIRSTCASTDLSLDTQDQEILNILEELQGSANPRVESTEQCRLTGNFVSDNVFNLSNKVLIDTEIRVLEKGLYFAPIQNKLNEPELRRDFKEFCRRMRLKWYFRNESTQTGFLT